MLTLSEVTDFLAAYGEPVPEHALQLRKMLQKELPKVTEQIDAPAKMIAYCYGLRYIDMVCVILPSKKGLKLGFSYGAQLPDPSGILEGNGKKSRYVVIKSQETISSPAVKQLVQAAYALYLENTKQQP